MLNKDKIKTGLIALALVVGVGTVGVGVVSADTLVTNKTGKLSGFATAIAQKFNLKEADVQAVIDEQIQKQHTEMEAKFVQDFATRLSTAVTAGKITQAQADLITAKQAEIKTQMDALHKTGVAPTEADKTAMKTLMDSVKTWADTNNIPKEFIMFGGRGNKSMHGKGFEKGPRGANAPTQTTTQ